MSGEETQAVVGAILTGLEKTSKLVTGKDAPFRFHIADCAPCYGDNEGSLTVRVFEEE